MMSDSEPKIDQKKNDIVFGSNSETIEGNGSKTHDTLLSLYTLCTNQVSFKSEGIKHFLH